MEQVWYVAYGSNVAWHRFRCYLTGGRPDGGARVYEGSRDPAEPERMEPVTVPGGLVFAGASAVWGGGIAFFDPERDSKVAGRAYLVTADQLADVAAQEMRRPPGGAFAREMAALLPEVGSVHTMGPGRYDTIVRLGELDTIPMLTVTHADAAALEPAGPTPSYLSWIVRGLHESHGWQPERAAGYLAGFPGIAGRWTAEELADLGRAPLDLGLGAGDA